MILLVQVFLCSRMPFKGRWRNAPGCGGGSSPLPTTVSALGVARPQPGLGGPGGMILTISRM